MLQSEIDAAVAAMTLADATFFTAFKAYKDSQLSDLTGQVNTANAAVTAAAAAQKKAEDEATASKEAADKAAADAATAKAESDAALATANAARDKAVTELAAMTAQDQRHAAALLAALDWQAIDSEYADLQSKFAANSAKYDAARATLATLAAAINAPFADREAAAKAARVKELEAQLAAVK
jgi:hypothetical protein